MQDLAKSLQSGDRLVLGVDKIKSADIVLPAYNDPAGVTARFNLNLLERINRELGGDFDIGQFKHAPQYSERTGIAASFIESQKAQSVHIDALDQSFHFAKGERIQTEISRK